MTAAELAIQTNDLAPNGEVTQAVDALRLMLEALATADPDQAQETYDRARMIKAWAKIRKDASGLVQTACRLEAIALRRLGQLEAFRGLSPVTAIAARWLATKTDAEFAEILEELISKSETVIGLYRKHTARDAHDADQARHRSGRTVEHDGYGPDPYLRRSAAYLLSSLTETGEPFSIADVASELADRLGIDDTEPATDVGLKELVRYALSTTAEFASDDDPEVDAVARDTVNPGLRRFAPSFVTYQDPEISCTSASDWVRVPWRSAGIEQFRSMVALRRRQALDLCLAARRLQTLLRELERTKQRYPELDGCDDLRRHINYVVQPCNCSIHAMRDRALKRVAAWQEEESRSNRDEEVAS